MNFSFDFEMDDWMALHQDNIDNGQQFKRIKLLLQFAAPLGASFVLIRDYLSGGLNTVTIAAMVALAGAGYLFVPKLAMDRMLKTTRKNLEKGDNSEILGQHTITLSEEGLTHAQQDAKDLTKWSGFSRLSESGSHYFLYNTMGSAIVIPKHKINVDLAELDQLLKSKIG